MTLEFVKKIIYEEEYLEESGGSETDNDEPEYKKTSFKMIKSSYETVFHNNTGFDQNIVSVLRNWVIFSVIVVLAILTILSSWKNPEALYGFTGAVVSGVSIIGATTAFLLEISSSFYIDDYSNADAVRKATEDYIDVTVLFTFSWIGFLLSSGLLYFMNQFLLILFECHSRELQSCIVEDELFTLFNFAYFIPLLITSFLLSTSIVMTLYYISEFFNLVKKITFDIKNL